jgi:hypothetical protein
LNTHRESKYDLASCVICLLIGALIFLSNDRSACGRAIKNSKTSRVCQTDTASHCTKHARRNEVGIIVGNRNFDIGHSSENGPLNSQTFNATHSHPTIVDEIRECLGRRHGIIRGVKGIVRLKHQAHKE